MPRSLPKKPPTASRSANSSTPTHTAPTDETAKLRSRSSPSAPRFAVYMGGEGTEPTYVVEGREALTPIFEDLKQYEATTHFNGQSTIRLAGDRATGESYTIAHHLFSTDGERKIMVAALRYLDTFTKVDRTWLFAERQLILDWSETRPSQQ